jgi:subtilisin-like proprotein convertase family protein
MVFAAGNSGNGEANGLGGSPGSILSPATAKNVITVGSSELLRNITNAVTNCTAISCETNLPWLAPTDSYDQISSFSSRGNVGIGVEGPFGRFKPDVIAPGNMVVSCRSSDYVESGASFSVIGDVYNFVDLPPLATNIYSVAIPANCGEARIFVRDNSQSPASIVDYPLWIDAEMETYPADPPLGQNSVTLTTATTPGIVPGTLFYSIGNPHSNAMNVDVVVQLLVTNNIGNYVEVLTDLNNAMGSSYRYEQGTSMSAGVVSGFLALMEEFFRVNFGVTNSPALNKALLINGARSLGVQYNYQVKTPVNHQGWGLINLSNTIPPGITTAQKPLWFFDQSDTNALATGDWQTYTITVPPRARSTPLRVSLVWTDPAGNPVSSLKLVNDLDLFVDGAAVSFVGTNQVSSTNRWVGNNFGQSSDFTQPIFLSDTNGATTNDIAAAVDSVRDTVNNVENVYIAPPLGDTYTITVRGARVAVNAVNTHSNGIVQDYALVISSGDGVTNSSGITVSAPLRSTDGTPLVTAMQRNGQTNPIALLNQHVGANSPYLTTTNGMTNQWAFYTFTNVTTFANVAFLTFLPPNTGFLRPDTGIDPLTPRHSEADIDLYVARSSSGTFNYYDLTNLDSKVIEDSDRSTRRGGTEFVIYSNAQPGEIFYIGVKSEDQQAATFGLFAVATQNPLNRKESNNIIAEALFVPVEIPDGTPDQPGGTNIFAFVFDSDVTVQRAYVTNTITHENAGDLIGVLSHTDSTSSKTEYATLNNHRYWFGTQQFLYDDSDQGDLTGSITSDGPGTLKNFVGHNAMGLWTFTISDNAMFHTGSVDGLTLVIEPATTNADLPVDITRTIGAGKWLYAGFDVATPDITNAHACVQYTNSTGNGPVNLYLRRLLFPTQTAYDKALLGILFPGDCLDHNTDDSPALSMGRYFAGVYNDSATPVTIRLTVRLDRSINPIPSVSFVNESTTPLIDDAMTNSTMLVTTQGLVSGVEVDVRLNHPRASDLVLYLKNPAGTRVMLAENRGRDLATGYGLASTQVVITNFGVRVLDDGFEQTKRGVYFVGSKVSGWEVGWNRLPVFSAVDGPAHSGTNFIDLNGPDADSAVRTNVTGLVPGKGYLLSYAFTRNPDSAAFGAPTALVTTNGTPIYTNDTTGIVNTWTDLKWQTSLVPFVALSPRITLQFESDSGGTYGMLLDTVRIDEFQVFTNSTLYTTFTEDTTKLPIPIKFAPPPFGDTTYIGTNVPISGFELVTNRAMRFTNSEQFDGWTVLTNSVLVMSNSGVAYSSNNYLLLRTGVVSHAVATVPGKEYVLSFATRTAERDIYNTGVDHDNVPIEVPLEFTAIDPHYATNDASLGLVTSNAYVLTNTAMLTTWYNYTNGDSRWIGISPTDQNVGGGDHSYVTRFNLSGYDTNTARLVIDFACDGDLYEVQLNNEVVAATPTGSATAFTQLIIDNTSGKGFLQRGNKLEFKVRNTNPTHGFRAEPVLYASLINLPNFQAVPRVTAATGRVTIEGSATNDFTTYSDGWRVYTVAFVAKTNPTTLDFTGFARTNGNSPSVWLDEVQIRDTGRKYYLPEEPMAPFLGQPGQGDWTLEVWDSRNGALLTGADLLSWRLRLSYVRTNAPFIMLSNNVATNASVAAGDIRYFVFNVPCDGATVNYTITGGPFDVLFNQNTFPTGTRWDDVLLAGNTLNPTFTMTVGFDPLVRTGRHYIGVSNLNSGTMTFNILATYSCPPPDTVAFNPLKLATSGFGPNGVSLSWSAPPGSEFAVQYASSPVGPWSDVPTTFTSTTGQFSFTDDGSLTGGLPPQRFYKLKQTK